MAAGRGGRDGWRGAGRGGRYGGRVGPRRPPPDHGHGHGAPAWPRRAARPWRIRDAGPGPRRGPGDRGPQRRGRPGHRRADAGRRVLPDRQHHEDVRVGGAAPTRRRGPDRAGRLDRTLAARCRRRQRQRRPARHRPPGPAAHQRPLRSHQRPRRAAVGRRVPGAPLRPLHRGAAGGDRDAAPAAVRRRHAAGATRTPTTSWPGCSSNGSPDTCGTPRCAPGS